MAQTFIRGGQILAGSITNAQIAVGLPMVGTDVVTRDYLEAAIASTNLKQAVRVSPNYSAVLSDICAGNTLDGVILQQGDRVLLRNQVNPEHNGIYVAGAGIGGQTRATDANTSAKLKDMIVFVAEGTNADSGFKLINDDTTITIDVTYLVYAKFTSSVSASSFVTGETPTGAVDGINQSFNSVFAAQAGTYSVYLNGLLQSIGDDYTVTGAGVQFITAPVGGDKVKLSYIKA